MSNTTPAPGVHSDSVKRAEDFHPEYYDQDRPEVARLLPENYSKVLEIGCGKGLFRKNLTKPHEYWGVEPVQSAAEEAGKHLDKVLLGIYDDVEDQIPDQEFDLVVCNDVIEHMVDHEKFFTQIKKKIKKGGYLISSIPNIRQLGCLYQILWKRDFRYRKYGLLDRTHLRFFTRKSLRRTILEHGYRIDGWENLNPLVLPLYWKIPAYCVVAVLGWDTQYLQFGIRIQPIEEKR